jgi:hypothetical protein
VAGGGLVGEGLSGGVVIMVVRAPGWMARDLQGGWRTIVRTRAVKGDKAQGVVVGEGPGGAVKL